MAARSFLQLAALFLQFNILVQASRPANIMTGSPLITYVASPDPYVTHSTAFTIYTAPYPPPPHRHHHHHHHKRKQLHSQIAEVTGHVFCDICKNGQIKEPLKGVTIGVTCWNGKEEQSFYGTTNKSGKFKVKLSGYNLQKHGGAKSCLAKLIYPSFRTSCMLPTNFHDGKLGARLRVMSETPQKIVLLAGPFVYTTPSKNKKCHQKDGNKHIKTSSSHSYKHSRQHEIQEGPSCPIDDCKSLLLQA